ncbi:MAG: TIGR04255 family protein [Candidatus Binatia bacterium]
MSGAANPPIPKFERPPVYETVLGVQFNPLNGFSVPHYGLYWANIRESYPKYEVHPPLSPAVEEFGSGAWKEAKTGIEVVPVPDVRTWFLNKEGTILLQVQKDRFLQNWRKVQDSDVYPHYDQLRPKFSEEWQRFCRFLEEVGIESPDVNQCEVTYVNHIDVDLGPKSSVDLHKVITCWSGKRSGNFLPEQESVSFNSRYLLPEKKGRLHVAMQPVIRRRDAKEILRLNLTVRGKPNSSELNDIVEWLNLGHDWAVRGFADITTPEMHQIWGRTQ